MARIMVLTIIIITFITILIIIIQQPQRIMHSVNTNLGSAWPGFPFLFYWFQIVLFDISVLHSVKTKNNHYHIITWSARERLTWFSVCCQMFWPAGHCIPTAAARPILRQKKDFSPKRHSHYSVLFFSISFPINSRLKAGDESARACLAAAGRQLTTVRTVRNCGRGERGVEEGGSWLLAPSGFTTAGSSTGAESVTERLLGGGGVGVDTGATTLQFSIFYLLWINPMQSDNTEPRKTYASPSLRNLIWIITIHALDLP